MVKIRFRRIGKKKQPYFRIVVTDSRSPRDGRFIETIGHYNPRKDPPSVYLKEDKFEKWLSVGAKPSESVIKVLKSCGIWKEETFSGEKKS